ncbi:MAG: GGDEF domain-containing protein [Neptuniibacter sp.]
MKFAENNNQAAEYLRQAVPLMVKHNIPPNPLNYALWYTYVSDRVPELNVQLDKTLTTYGTCPTMLSEQLFREHMIKDEIQGSEDIQANLISLINNLHEHAGDVAKESASFSDVLEDSLDSLKKSEDGETSLPVESVIAALSTHTKKMSETTRLFQDRMDEAQAEIQSLKEELNKSRQDARVDPLTNLFNRRTFDAELEMLTAGNQSITSSFVLVDVDHFKRFNDTYGHLMGDKVLQYVGKLLKDSCPEPMIPVRYGGEEFAVLMPGSTQETASKLAEEIRAKIQAIRIKQKKSGEVISSITASFGVSQLVPGETPEKLIERTDQALYQAKESGRNRVIVSS